MEILKIIGLVLVSYLLGSIPWGFLIGKAKGIDVRKEGSKNIGATNVTRCVGKWAGKLCFALDFLKGMLPVLAAQYLLGGKLIDVSEAQEAYVVIGVLFAAVLGHIFPVFLNFRGGKGISTAAGAIVALNWIALVAALAVWVVVFLVSRYVSLASIVAAAVLPIVGWVMYLVESKYCPPLSTSPVVLIFLTVISLVAIIRHHSNIQRLLKGTENRFGRKSE
jgi:glycerol-3-phosphate acyltransferase PlsY